MAFTASWCQPCKNMRPTLDKLPKAFLVEHDVDEDRLVVELYDVKAVPTFIVLDSEGAEIARHMGAVSYSVLAGYLE